MSKAQNDQNKWGIFGLVTFLVWLFIFLSVIINLSKGEMLIYAACSGGIGATMYIAQNLYFYWLIKNAFISRYIGYYLILPIFGVITGVIVYRVVNLFLNATLFNNQIIILSLCLSWLAGHRQSRPLFKLLEEVTNRFIKTQCKLGMDE